MYCDIYCLINKMHLSATSCGNGKFKYKIKEKYGPAYFEKDEIKNQ